MSLSKLPSNWSSEQLMDIAVIIETQWGTAEGFPFYRIHSPAMNLNFFCTFAMATISHFLSYLCSLLLVVSIGGEVEKGRAYIYASEIEDLKNTNLSTEAFDQNLGEFKHVRSVSICLAQCLDVPNCLSFQWNKITMLCRLFSISVAEALPHGIQNGNRYFSVLKGMQCVYSVHVVCGRDYTCTCSCSK